MDYLQFLFITVLSLIVGAIASLLHLGVTGMIGIGFVTIITLTRLKRESHALAYLYWMILFVLAYSYISPQIPEYLAAHPEKKINPAAFKGAYIVLILIVLHPISYAFGKLSFWSANKIRQFRHFKSELD